MSSLALPDLGQWGPTADWLVAAAIAAAAFLLLVLLRRLLRRRYSAVITVAVFWQFGVWLSAAFVAWLDRKRRESLENDRAMIGSISIFAYPTQTLLFARDTDVSSGRRVQTRQRVAG